MTDGCAALKFDPLRAAFGPDAGLIKAACEIVELQEQINKLLSDQNPEIDDDAREAAAPLKEKQKALLDLLMETQTNTFDGLFARARVLQAYAFPRDISVAYGYDQKMIFKLVSDILNLSKMTGAPGVGAAPVAGSWLSEARQFAMRLAEQVSAINRYLDRCEPELAETVQ